MPVGQLWNRVGLLEARIGLLDIASACSWSLLDAIKKKKTEKIMQISRWPNLNHADLLDGRAGDTCTKITAITWGRASTSTTHRQHGVFRSGSQWSAKKTKKAQARGRQKKTNAHNQVRKTLLLNVFLKRLLLCRNILPFTYQKRHQLAHPSMCTV